MLVEITTFSETSEKKEVTMLLWMVIHMIISVWPP